MTTSPTSTGTQGRPSDEGVCPVPWCEELEGSGLHAWRQPDVDGPLVRMHDSRVGGCSLYLTELAELDGSREFESPEIMPELEIADAAEDALELAGDLLKIARILMDPAAPAPLAKS